MVKTRAILWGSVVWKKTSVTWEQLAQLSLLHAVREGLVWAVTGSAVSKSNLWWVAMPSHPLPMLYFPFL